MVATVCTFSAAIIISLISSSWIGMDVSYLPEPSLIFSCILIGAIIALFIFAMGFLLISVPKRLHQINQKYDREDREREERYEKILGKK